VTYFYEVGVDQSYWTADYSVCYVFAPLVGAFMAGNTFIYLKRLIRRIDENDYESDNEDERIKNKKTMKIEV
jgi:hypothetical protein